MTYICTVHKEQNNTNLILNKMKNENLQLTIFFAIVAILTITVHFCSSEIYR